MTFIVSLIGFSLVLLVPGYLASLLMFRQLNSLDRLLVSIGLSIVMTAALALILGTGAFGTAGITSFTVWAGLLSVTAALGVAVLVQRR